MLHTTIFDDEISLNAGNDATILPSLEAAYKKACPAIASMKLAKWARVSPVANNAETAVQSSFQETVSEASMDNTGYTLQGSRDSGDCIEDTLQNDIESIFSDLAKSKIHVSQISVSTYVREVLTPEDSHNHDMVLTEPPHNLSASDISEAVDACKRVLKPGSTFFAIIDWLELPIWHKALREADFSVMPYPFVMCYLSGRLQKTRSISMPFWHWLLLRLVDVLMASLPILHRFTRVLIVHTSENLL